MTDRDYVEEIEKLVNRISQLEDENASLRLLDETITRNTAMFEALVANSSVGIALIGTDRRIVRLVRSAFGFSADEVAGRAFETILHPDDQAILVDCCTQLLDGSTKSVEFEGRVCVPDGSVKWVLARLTDMLDDPNVQAIVCNYVDVTQQKERELILAEFADIVASVDRAVFSEGLDARILTWNPGAERLFGYPPEEVLGCDAVMLAPPELHREEQRVREEVRETTQAAELRTIRICRDGSRIPALVRVAAVLDRYGRPRGFSHLESKLDEH
jgi:PAS domain S-box-containing protein